MNTDKFIFCLAMTESHDNPNAQLGDNGRALGRFQVHPDWVWTQCKRFGIQPTLNETWDSFITRLVTAFYNHYAISMSPVDIAMYFHIGHVVTIDSPDWDKGYATRFNGYAEKNM